MLVVDLIVGRHLSLREEAAPDVVRVRGGAEGRGDRGAAAGVARGGERDGMRQADLRSGRSPTLVTS